MPSTLLKHVSPTKAKKRRLESSAPVERRRAQRQLQWNNQEEERAAEDLLEDDRDEIERRLKTEPNVPKGFVVAR